MWMSERSQRSENVMCPKRETQRLPVTIYSHIQICSLNNIVSQEVKIEKLKAFKIPVTQSNGTKQSQVLDQMEKTTQKIIFTQK